MDYDNPCHNTKESTMSFTARNTQQLHLTVSPNGRFFRRADQEPFFWLGDTAWLLLVRLDLEQIEFYLRRRADQGFNVIQVMLVHRFHQATVEGYRAIPQGRFDLLDSDDRFWQKLDQVLDLAGRLGIVLALVPMWGSNVLEGHLTVADAERYGQFLGSRYRSVPNIVWLNGGDIRGEDHPEVWRALGNAIKQADPDHLMTYHPFGRTDSSWWFHIEPWLDFNMFQSGHRRYGQLQAEGDYRLTDGLEEDNWRYVRDDRQRNPAKPTLDGEPAYEAIPRGLLDIGQPLWQAKDCRRYAWWSVLAGAAGHTYGHNAVMQMNDAVHPPAYGCQTAWPDALDAPGACQMAAVGRLLCVFADEDREPVFIDGQPQYYDHLALLRGTDFLIAYAYQGEAVVLAADLVTWQPVVCSWYDPRLACFTASAEPELKGQTLHFRKPDGDDWVLVICSPDRQASLLDKYRAEI
jgi:hypothetical protein